METVRAKFKVDSILQTLSGETIELTPVINGSEENKIFYKYTPGGKICLQTVNHEAAEVFVPGKEFYIDFTAAN